MKGVKNQNTINLIQITGKPIKEVARLVGYHPNALSYALTGKCPMSIKLAEKLSALTGLSSSYFLQYNEHSDIPSKQFE